jgi:hypothetical protein
MLNDVPEPIAQLVLMFREPMMDLFRALVRRDLPAGKEDEQAVLGAVFFYALRSGDPTKVSFILSLIQRLRQAAYSVDTEFVKTAAGVISGGQKITQPPPPLQPPPEQTEPSGGGSYVIVGTERG